MSSSSPPAPPRYDAAEHRSNHDEKNDTPLGTNESLTKEFLANPFVTGDGRGDFSAQTTPAHSEHNFSDAGAMADTKDTKEMASEFSETTNDPSNNLVGSNAEDHNDARETESKEEYQQSDTEKNTGPPVEPIPITNLEKGIVGWDSQDDPAYPRNFTKKRKMILLALVTVMTLTSALASSMFSPAATSLAAEFKITNKELLAFCVSVYLLGYAVCLLITARFRKNKNKGNTSLMNDSLARCYSLLLARSMAVELFSTAPIGSSWSFK